MSRHRTCLKDYDGYDENYYDDDDYYEETPRQQMERQQPSNLPVVIKTTSKQGKKKQQQKDQDKFLKASKELLGNKVQSDSVLINIFNNCSCDHEKAINALLESLELHENGMNLSSSPASKADFGKESQQQLNLSSVQVSVDHSPTLNTKKIVTLPQKHKHEPNTMTKNDNYKPTLKESSPASIPSSSPAAVSQASKGADLSDDEYDDVDTRGGDRKPHLSMVVAGHVDAGKSTLIGHLLFKIGLVSQKQMRRNKQESQTTGKSSFFLAWVMDESQEERDHGVTIHVAEKFFQTEHREFVVLDAPGHRDFVPNMIKGATQADVGLLVVPATVGEFESSMGSNAQTREHAVLLKALGVNQIIVVINKMDQAQPPWGQNRYLEIMVSVQALLADLRFSEHAIRFVPVSGLSGENLVERCKQDHVLHEWYQDGPCLVELLDTFMEPERKYNAPLRACITGSSGTHARDIDLRINILQGCVKKGRGVAVSDIQGVFEVREITTDDGTAVDRAFAGESVNIVVRDRGNRSADESRPKEGQIVYKGPPLPPLACRVLKATIVTQKDLFPPIIPGSVFEMYLHGSEILCHVRKIYSISLGSETVLKPKCIPADRIASVKIELVNPACIEAFTSCKALGRFALRSKGHTCAVGVCDKTL